MRRKLLKTLMLSSAIALSAIPMSSCSMFFGESGYMIENIQTSYNEQTGDTTVIITFNDDEAKPMTFVVPRGISGVDGVGIRDILSDVVTEEDGSQSIKVTILYTDKEVANTELKIPIAKDGRGISKVLTDVDKETGDTILQFEYTDGTKSESINIPKGVDGKQGVGIDFIDVSPSSDGVNTIITILYTDPEMAPTRFQIANGVGIESVDFDAKQTTETEYALVVKFTNGEEKVIKLPIPQSTKWHSGDVAPDNTIGKDDDFYINKVSGFTYHKVNGTWVYMFSMKGTGSSVQYTVSFNPNGGKFTSTGTTSPLTYVVNYGEYLDLNNFPQVSNDGFTFEGWYTDSSMNPNSGHFTDLTPVFKNMTLFARWSSK